MQILILYTSDRAVAVANQLQAALNQVQPIRGQLAPPHQAVEAAAIQRSDVLLVLLADPLPAVFDEAINQAQAQAKTLIPVLLEDVQIPLSLEGVHHVDMRHNVDAMLRKLVAEMRNRAGIVDAQTAPLQTPSHSQVWLDHLDMTDQLDPLVPEPAAMWPWVLAGLSLVGGGVIVLIVLTG